MYPEIGFDLRGVHTRVIIIIHRPLLSNGGVPLSLSLSLFLSLYTTASTGYFFIGFSVLQLTFSLHVHPPRSLNVIHTELYTAKNINKGWSLTPG